MAELSGLQVFKYLPAAKKLPEGNCKKCGFATCMAYALKLAKNQTQIELCPYAPEELKEIFAQSIKKPQKEVYLGHKNKVLIGGENVLFRHDKTFINKTAIGIVLDVSQIGWEEKLNRISDFEIMRVNEIFKIDLIYLKNAKCKVQNAKGSCLCEEGIFFPDEAVQKLDDANIPWVVEEDLKDLTKIEDGDVFETIQTLTDIRKKAVLEKDENFSNPVYMYFPSRHAEATNNAEPQKSSILSISSANDNAILKQVHNNVKSGHCNDALLQLTARASFYLCKYANMLVFEDLNEALISTLMTLRQNIYTDPQKPLQVESKIYEFNNADENSLIFLTTNFALTYFAVANEIEALGKPAYLVVTPSEGMSVLTAWSAEKFTAQIVAKTVNQFKLGEKVKNKRIIIPGLLSHMKDEIEEALPEFKVLVGPNEAYLLGDFVKSVT